jgi:hypothetical protein
MAVTIQLSVKDPQTGRWILRTSELKDTAASATKAGNALFKGKRLRRVFAVNTGASAAAAYLKMRDDQPGNVTVGSASDGKPDFKLLIPADFAGPIDISTWDKDGALLGGWLINQAFTWWCTASSADTVTDNPADTVTLEFEFTE